MSEIIDKLKKDQVSQHRGELLELVLVDILNDLGFYQVKRQQSGNQFGFDIIAYKESIDGEKEVWKFECKNLDKRVSLADIAPKLIWHLERSIIDRFVIVSTSSISNDLQHFLENHPFSMTISIWTGGILEDLIKQSPKAMRRLGLGDKKLLATARVDLEEIPSFYPKYFTLDAIHELDPPFSFDYLIKDGEIIKAYTEYEFRILVLVSNVTKRPLIIRSLDVVTLSYEKIDSRILRLNKAKGIYQPLQLTFNPSIISGDKQNILGNEVWQIEGGDAEAITLILSSETVPGLYNLILSVNGVVDGKSIIRNSGQFLLNVLDENNDLLRLQVMGRHHESPIPKILNLADEDWTKLKEPRENTFTFLGPTFYEMTHGYEHSNWTVRSQAVERQNDGITSHIQIDTPSYTILDLGIEVDEDLGCGAANAIKRLINSKENNILPAQIKRKTIFRLD